MNKSDLINKLDKKNLFKHDDLENSVNLVLNLISETLINSDRVEIRNFGTFSTRSRQSVCHAILKLVHLC